MNIIIGSFIYLARESIALFFTNSPELVSLITSTIGLMSLVIIIHGESMVLSGVLKGLGK